MRKSTSPATLGALCFGAALAIAGCVPQPVDMSGSTNTDRGSGGSSGNSSGSGGSNSSSSGSGGSNSSSGSGGSSASGKGGSSGSNGSGGNSGSEKGGSSGSGSGSGGSSGGSGGASGSPKPDAGSMTGMGGSGGMMPAAVAFGDIYPSIMGNCLPCHATAKGGIVMNDKATALMSLKGKAGIVKANDSKGSKLITLITPVGGKAAMPKGKTPLSDAEIAKFAAWIDGGAKE